jgi:membrane-bound lytic murein transglycosylase D
LWDIARKYRVSVNKLAKWNAMAPRDVLKQGQQLVIWNNTGSSSSQGTPAGLSENSTTQRIHYIVRNGDSLARISQRFKVKISELRSWNTLPKDKYLQPGQRLTLYVDVTRQAENI